MSADAAPATATETPPSKRGGDKAGLALMVGAAGLIVAGIGLVIGSATGNSRFAMSWLLGLSFWLSIGLGMLFLTMIWYVFDAGWSVVVRRQLEHGLAAIKWLGVIFLPLLLVPFLTGHPGVIWKWMDPGYQLASGGTVAGDVLYQAKAGYLNVGFFIFRALLYFGVFIGLAEFLRRCSFFMEEDGNLAWARRARVTSAFGIVALALTSTFAAFDWMMSLSYHWFSTMYGVWFFAASIRAATAVAAIVCILMMLQGRLGGGLFNQGHRYLLGCMLLAFTVFWAYIVFSQYFLIYNANIPEETYWYTDRLYAAEGGLSGWGWMLLGLVFFHFLFPFLLLLWYKTKVVTRRLLFVSGWIVFFHLLDLYYNVIPRQKAVEATAENPLGYVVSPIFKSGLDLVFDLGALAGIGGICVWAFLKSMQSVEVIPIRDPRIQESLNYHE